MNSLLCYLTLITSVFFSGIAVDEDKHVDEVINEIRLAIQSGHLSSPARMDDTLCVSMEWIRLRDSVVNRPFRRKAQYFLGYLSGRLRISPPRWWMSTLGSGVVSSDGVAGFDCSKLDRRWRTNDSGWKYSGLDDVQSASDKLFLEHDEKKVVLRRLKYIEIVPGGNEWNSISDGAISAAMQDNICVVACKCPISSPGGPSRISCLDVDTGDVLWTRKIASELSLPIAVGGQVGGSYTEIVIEDDCVVVWFAHDFSMCFEVFEKSAGKRIARFSTNQLDGIRFTPSNK